MAATSTATTSIAQADGASASASTSAGREQVPLTLKTSLPGLSLPPTQYLVPTTFSRSHLSTLVNRLLQQTADLTQTIPFDFIVDGQLLRESLQSWLEKNGKTVEEGVELEYVKSTLPPRWEGTFEHDDWVGSIDASRSDIFLTSSYDSSIRLFAYSSPQEPLLTHRVASGSTSSSSSLVGARWAGSGDASYIATAGLDGTVRLLSAPKASASEADGTTTWSTPRQIWSGTHHPVGGSKGKATATPGKSSSYGLAPSALTSLSVSPDGKALLTSSRDGSLAYWKLDEIAAQSTDSRAAEEDGDDVDEASRKRRKGLAGKKQQAATKETSKLPTLLLWHAAPSPSPNAGTAGAATPSHVIASNAQVSQAIFAPWDHLHAISVGWDGRLIEWDLFSAMQGGAAKLSQRGTSDSRAITSLAAFTQASPSSQRLVTGHMDRSLVLWDLSMAPGTPGSTLVLPNTHTGPVYDVSAHPTDANLFASCGGDGVVKVWDARSHRRALFSLSRPAQAEAKFAGGKLLACDWDRGSGADGQTASLAGQVVLAGGEDCAVNVFRGQGLGQAPRQHKSHQAVSY